MEQKETVCSVAKKCGGCRYQGVSYQEQLRRKQRITEGLLKKFGKVEPIIGMEDPYYYRNKVHAAFGRDRKGNVISGIYEEKSHRIVSVDDCMIEDKKSQEIIRTIRELLPSFKIKTYNEDTGYGLLRHVLVRRGFETGEIMVVLVLASPILPSKNNFVKALLKLHPEITTVVINVNNRNTSMVLGDKEHVIYGKGYIEDELCGKRFRISPKSFYQVNPVQTEILYGKALEYAGLTGKETVVDAYCGTGTIGMIASDKAGKVIGVELNADAVRDARNNAKANQIRNIQFYQNDAGKFLVEMASQGAKVDVVLMDPPRSGSTEEFINMPFAVIVLASDTAHRYLVTLGGGVEPRLLDLIDGHHFLARIIVKHLILLFPFCRFLVLCWLFCFCLFTGLALAGRNHTLVGMTLKHLLYISLSNECHSAAQS